MDGVDKVMCYRESLNEIFNRKLHIPEYQRCFCWRKRDILDLLETLSSRCQEKETHLGTIILKRNGEKLEEEIVDGQQRLLTLTILAHCLKKAEKVGTWKLPLLEASLIGTSSEAESARKHLLWAKTTISEWLLRSNAEFPENMLKQVQFCVVILPADASEDLAYTFFNAVNSAGKKLSDYDLLKAHHLRFVSDEAVSRSMAARWDNNDAESYGEILHKVLYRLRTWSRYAEPAVDAQVGHQLFAHYSARALDIKGIFFPPLALRFNSTLHGGAPFFHYAEQYRMSWQDFKKTEAYLVLVQRLSGHSGDVLRDCICALLFLFYSKFGKSYLQDALFCIAEAVSLLRNEHQVRATAIKARILSECVFALDTALDPGQFFDWCLSIERRYNQKEEGRTRENYWAALKNLYADLEEHLVSVRRQCQLRIMPNQNENESAK